MWKKWPTWLKGGLIGILVFVLDYIVLFRVDSNGGNYNFLSYPFLASIGWAYKIILFLPLPNLLFGFSNVVYVLILFFLIGSFAGYIVKKIKQRK